MLYGIDDSYYMVLGIQLNLPGIQLIATDLNGKLIYKTNYFSKVIPEPSLAVRTISDAIIGLISQYHNYHILGLGIASPGFIDQTTGDIISIGRVPNWKNFPICRHLTEATDLPVQIANDVDCMAIAEFRDEKQLLRKNLIYVGFCEGLKVSLFLDGKLYKGSIGNVGLISADLLNLGINDNTVADKQLFTANGFILAFDQRISELPPSEQGSYQNIVNLSKEREKFSAILSRALEKEAVCFPLIQNLINLLSVAIANIIYLIQPDEIVIGGMLSALPKQLFSGLERSIRKNIPSLISNNLIIKKGMIEPTNNAALGAILHFLHSKLNNILRDS
jgi:glucokinase